MGWSEAMCTTLSKPGPMSAPRAAKALIRHLTAELTLRVLLTHRHLHLGHNVDPKHKVKLKHKVNLARVVTNEDSRFSDC